MGDEGEYWDRWQKPDESRVNPSAAERSKEKGTGATREYRSAPQPSPLLQEYMKKKGIPVK